MQRASTSRIVVQLARPSVVSSMSASSSNSLVGVVSRRALATAASSSASSSSAISEPSPSTTATLPPSLQKHARTRPLPQRKKLLYSSHAHLLSSNELVLFLRQGDFTAQEYAALRTQLAHLATDGLTSLKLTVLRPGLLPALLRDERVTSTVDATYLGQLSHLKGPMSILTASTLHPPTLKKVLKLVRTVSQSPSRNAPPPDPKNTKPEVEERLSVLSVLAENRAFDAAKVDTLGELPSLDTLRAQLVGLLSSPGSRIVGVLGSRASELGRTLEGLKVGLEKQQQPTEAEKAS